uniref:Protein cornichon homolog 1 n=1 Tax=Steinernema glaseri TaxID=37863 RepID=A0A1I8A5L2_9BILA
MLICFQETCKEEEEERTKGRRRNRGRRRTEEGEANLDSRPLSCKEICQEKEEIEETCRGEEGGKTKGEGARNRRRRTEDGEANLDSRPSSCKVEPANMAFTFAAFCYLIALIAIAFCIFFAIFTVRFLCLFANCGIDELLSWLVICIDELRTDYKNPIEQCRNLNQVICIDELRTDYKNPIEQCRNLNQLILPEYGIHLVFSILFVLSVQLGAVIWNLPLLAYHVHRYMNRPVMSGPGIYDPTTIMNQDNLSKAYREGWVKLGFYLISFFYYLYALIYTLVTTS